MEVAQPRQRFLIFHLFSSCALLGFSWRLHYDQEGTHRMPAPVPTSQGRSHIWAQAAGAVAHSKARRLHAKVLSCPVLSFAISYGSLVLLLSLSSLFVGWPGSPNSKPTLQPPQRTAGSWPLQSSVSSLSAISKRKE